MRRHGPIGRPRYSHFRRPFFSFRPFMPFRFGGCLFALLGLIPLLLILTLFVPR